MESSQNDSSDFKLPDGVEFPEELLTPTPRPLPNSVKQGPLAEEQRKLIRNCVIASVLCVAIAPIPFVETLSLYVLPLAYLSWIGLGLAVIAVWIYVNESELKRACLYIKKGEVAFARVRALVKSPTLITNGEATAYAFIVEIQLLHPDTGEPCFFEVSSRTFGSGKKDLLDTRFRVDDVIPVVWLPDEFESTLQIYDFLEVTPEASLAYNAPTMTPTQTWVSIGLFMTIPFGICALFWNVYAYGRYDPLDLDFTHQALLPLIIGGLLGFGGVLLLFYTGATSKKKIAERNIEAANVGNAVELEAQQSIAFGIFMKLVLIFGGVLLGGVTVLCWCFTANALLDTSEPRPVPAQITESIQTTHALIFRDYSLKYQLSEDKEERSLLTTPQHLARFTSPMGIAMVSEGWLGWPWVKSIEPVNIDKKLVSPNAEEKPE